MAIDYQVRSCSCSPNWGLAAYSCTLAASNPTRMSQTSPRTLTCPRLFADVWVVEEHEKDRAVGTSEGLVSGTVGSGFLAAALFSRVAQQKPWLTVWPMMLVALGPTLAAGPECPNGFVGTPRVTGEHRFGQTESGDPEMTKHGIR